MGRRGVAASRRETPGCLREIETLVSCAKVPDAASARRPLTIRRS